MYQFFGQKFSTQEIEKQERQKKNYKTVGGGEKRRQRQKDRLRLQ
jgi:hypothetical protein